MITDFQAGVDRLILAGMASNYSVRNSGTQKAPRYEIFFRENGNTDELVAILQSASLLTASNTINNAIYV